PTLRFSARRLPPPRRAPPFPYTTLFRSLCRRWIILRDKNSVGQTSCTHKRVLAHLIAKACVRAMPGHYGRLFIEGIQATVVTGQDRKSTRLNSSHVKISYAVFCLKKKKY